MLLWSAAILQASLFVISSSNSSYVRYQSLAKTVAYPHGVLFCLKALVAEETES
jgi:hypothetical protein